VLVVAAVIFFLGGRRIGLLLAGWGVLLFIVAVAVVIPLLSPTGTWVYLSSLGGGSSSVWGDLLNSAKLETVLWLLLICAAIALCSPLAWILVPSLAWRFLSSNSGYWGHGWHYSAVLMPVLFCAAIDGMHRARTSAHRWFQGYGKVAAASVVAVALVFVPQTPIGSMLRPDYWHPSSRAASASAALATVRQGSTIESDIGLMSYLVTKGTVYWIGNKNPIPDFVVVDRVGGGGGTHTALQWAQTLHPDIPYTTVFDRDGYQVAARSGGVTG